MDILVRIFEDVCRLRKEIKLVEYSAYEQKAVFVRGDVKIHLHGKVSWTREGTTFLDDELIWESPRMVTMGPVRVRIPNVDADFLVFSRPAHLNYEKLYITLSDLLYIYNSRKCQSGSSTRASKKT